MSNTGRDRASTLGVSPWPSPSQPTAAPLQGATSADVAIVGGGITGLSAALALQEEGLDVAVLEARRAGYGASGRNAGHLAPTIGKDLPHLLRMCGVERARALLSLADASVVYTEEMISRHAIDCDYEDSGNIVAAVHASQFNRLDKAESVAATCGVPGRLLGPDEMRERRLPGCFLRGYFESRGGILNPLAYTLGLKAAAESAGARVYEDSPVVAVESGSRPRLLTAAGEISASHLIVATNAYAAGPELPRRLRSVLMPLYVQLFQTAPLDAEQLGRIGWNGREGVYTAHEALENFRLTRDDRILGGSKYVRYAYGGGRLRDKDGHVAIRLERVFRKRFPELSDVAITDHWGGRIGLGLDFLPAIGRLPGRENVLYSIAYAGHGLPMATLAGSMLADLISGREGPGAALWNRRRIPLPPEPFRWLAFNGLSRIFDWLDRRVDRRIEEES